MSPGKSGKKGLRSGGSMWQRAALGPRLTIGHRDSRWRYCPKIASAAVGKVCEALPSLTDSHLRLTVAATKSVAVPSCLGRFGQSHALGDDGEVARTAGQKAQQALTGDGGGVDADGHGNSALGIALSEHDLDGQAIREAKVTVVRVHGCNTLVDKTCCTSKLSRPSSVVLEVVLPLLRR